MNGQNKLNNCRATFKMAYLTCPLRVKDRVFNVGSEAVQSSKLSHPVERTFLRTVFEKPLLKLMFECQKSGLLLLRQMQL
jgi:hypothetical protein